MKLAIYLRAPEVWGAERSLLTLLASKPAKDHSIVVFVSPHSPLRAELERLGITWKPFHFIDHRSIAEGGLKHASVLSVATDLIHIVLAGVKARTHMKSYDAVVTFGLWETPEIALACRLSRTPVVFDFHVTFSGRAGRFALKQIMRLVTGVIAPARATYTQAGIDADRLSRKQLVVPRPVVTPDLPITQEALSGRRVLRVGIFGQVDERKGVREVIEALRPLKDTIHLLIVGIRPLGERTRYEMEIISTLEGTGSHWTAVPRSDEVPLLMSQCDVVLNMSRHEAFGRTVVEAACVGSVPIVLTGGGPEEIVRDMGVGTVVASWDELRNCLIGLSECAANGEDLRLTDHQVRIIREKYSPEVVAAKYFMNIQQLTSGRSSRAGRAARIVAR